MGLTIPGEIVLNSPGDGEWIMEHVGGTFVPGMGHVIARHAPGGRMLGGFVMCDFLGKAITVHAAGGAGGWCTKTLLWMMSNYAFIQLGCAKLISMVRADNNRSLANCLKLGFRMEAVLRGVYEDGADMVILTQTAAECRWLTIRPEGWAPGAIVRAVRKEAA